jgi:hypothetical protein
MSQKLRFTEARHDALRAAADGLLTFEAGKPLMKGTYWVQLRGMPEDEKVTSPRLEAAATALVAHGYLRHVHPGVPRRSGAVEITDPGRVALLRFDDAVTRRNANA